MVHRLVWLLILAGSHPVLAASPLDASCRLDIRGVPLKQALDDLTGRLGIPFLLDASVTDQDAQTPVRLFAAHLTGQEAFRWLARWAGLEAVLIDGTVLVARPDRLPATWRRIAVTSATTDGGSDEQSRWQAARQRQADIQWIDAPLSFVVRDVSARFGIDLIFHRKILKKKDLIHLKRSQVRLDQLCDLLSRHFDAKIEYLDGALWARPKPEMATSRPVQGTQAPASQAARPNWVQFLGQRMAIDLATVGWTALGESLASATGLSCRVLVPPDTPGPAWEAQGSAADILEAGQLLGRLDYRVQQIAPQKPPVLLIQVHPDGRYPP